MSDDNPHSSNGSSSRSWLTNIVNKFKGEPQNKEELSDLISDAEERELIDPQTKEMLEFKIPRNFIIFTNELSSK